MDTSPFDIAFTYRNESLHANIHPCCREGDIVDYAVWQDGKLMFTITKETVEGDHWVIALKNADDDFDEELIQVIGDAIAMHKSF